MKTLFAFFLSVHLSISVAVASLEGEVSKRVAEAAQSHPRLMVDAETFAKINRAAEKDERLAGLRKIVIKMADKVLDRKPVERKLEGKRLLSVSREALERISSLAMAYRLTDDKRYLVRAEKEMMAVCGFEDWNPSHFLDVAEMTLALALGYDWLHDALSTETRTAVRDAILHKGIEPSFARKHGWIRGTNNWNQVCHGGIVSGALAILEDEPELAARAVQRAVEGVPVAMKVSYDPDGAYPEGPSYWSYGTTFNVILLSCLNSALETDFGLSKAKGFDITGVYLNMCAGPSGQWFNYADCGASSAGYRAALCWLADEFDRPGLARLNMLKSGNVKNLPGGRDAVLALVWEASRRFTAEEIDAAEPLPRTRLFGGDKPVWIHCNSWSDPDTAYVAVCGGTPSSNHGHMDSGAFIYESDGIRWAIDLGSQGYHSLESRGVGLWDRKQDGERWEVFRLSNHSHNTLVFDGGLQQVKGFATIEDSTSSSSGAKNPGAVVDLTPLYDVPTSGIKRTFEVAEESGALTVSDEIAGLKKATTMRWGMATRAEVALKGAEAVLTQEGKRLVARIEKPAGAEFKVIDMEKPRRDYDYPNKGVRMLAVEVVLKPGSMPHEVVVTLTPGK